MPNIRKILSVTPSKQFATKLTALGVGSYLDHTWDGNTYSMLTDGSTKRLVTANDVIDITGTISISIRVKMVTSGSLNCFICKDNSSGSDRSWNMTFRTTDNKVRVWVWNTDGTLNELISSTANVINDGNWHTVGYTFDGTTGADKMILYVDGAEDNTMTSGSTGIRTYSGTFSGVSVGALNGTTIGWPTNAYFDEAALWNGVELTAANMTSIHNSGSADDLSSFSPTTWIRMGDFGIWDGSNWMCPDIGSAGDGLMTSQNMVNADRTTEVS